MPFNKTHDKTATSLQVHENHGKHELTNAQVDTTTVEGQLGVVKSCKRGIRLNIKQAKRDSLTL